MNGLCSGLGVNSLKFIMRFIPVSMLASADGYLAAAVCSSSGTIEWLI